MNNIEKHRAFIESLEGEKGLPDEWRLLTPGLDKWLEGDEFLHSAWHGDAESFHWRRASLIGEVVEAGAVGRRPTYRQIPDLKEKVKAFGRDIIVDTAPQTQTEINQMEKTSKQAQIKGRRYSRRLTPSAGNAPRE